MSGAGSGRSGVGRRRPPLLPLMFAVLVTVLGGVYALAPHAASGSTKVRPQARPHSRTASGPAAASSSSPSGSASSAAERPPAAAARGADRPLPSEHLSVVALGDSVPSGYNCGCRPFPELVGDGLRHDGNVVSLDNLAQPGETASGLAQALRTSAATRSAVAGADVVLIEIGANDLLDTRSHLQDDECPGGGISCYDDALHQMHADVTTVLDEVRQLRAGQHTDVLVLDYWAVFEDGQVARGQTSQQGLVTDDEVTLAANVEICAAAQDANDHCVDVRPTFRDIDGSRDATPLLAPDGDHPNAAGHRALAETVLAVLRPTLPEL